MINASLKNQDYILSFTFLCPKWCWRPISEINKILYLYSYFFFKLIAPRNVVFFNNLCFYMSNKAETTGFIIIQIYLSGRSLKNQEKGKPLPWCNSAKKKKKNYHVLENSINIRLMMILGEHLGQLICHLHNMSSDIDVINSHVRADRLLCSGNSEREVLRE